MNEALLCCPSCRGDLAIDRCSVCERAFVRDGSQLRFVTVQAATVDAAFQIAEQNQTNLTGRIFRAGKAILSSEYRPLDHLGDFLKGASGVVVELGSGSRRLRDDVLTIDLFPSANVDIAADIAETPLRDGCADFVILDAVLEHVADPVKVVAEARRILKPGGRLFVDCPFLFPYHGYPGHYQNLSRDGLEHILRDFDDVEIRPSFGPMSAWVNLTAETFAVLVGGERGLRYMLARACALLPIFWLKYLDRFFVRSGRSHRISGTLVAIATR